MDVNELSNEYIDVEGALKRVGGNMDLYKRLLGRFIDGNNLDPLCAAIDSGDMEEAARLTHTIKGVSSNLSLTKVASLSVQLEQLIKNNDDYNACLSEFKQAYSTTVEKIAEITG